MFGDYCSQVLCDVQGGIQLEYYYLVWKVSFFIMSTDFVGFFVRSLRSLNFIFWGVSFFVFDGLCCFFGVFFIGFQYLCFEAWIFLGGVFLSVVRFQDYLFFGCFFVQRGFFGFCFVEFIFEFFRFWSFCFYFFCQLVEEFFFREVWFVLVCFAGSVLQGGQVDVLGKF